MTDINKLQALAEAATTGKWSTSGSYIAPTREEAGTTYVENWRSIALVSADADRAFIAAANPAAVLELIAEIERLERKNSNQAQTIREYSDLVMGGDVSLGMLRADIRVTTGERDQLKAENTDLHATLQAAKGEIERLKSENEALLDNPGDAL